MSSDEKLFTTARAQLAMQGAELARTDPRDGTPVYYVTFRGLDRRFLTICAVQEFASKLGAIRSPQSRP